MRLHIIIICSALLASVPALAQKTAEPVDTLPDYEMDQVVVTGTRTPKSLKNTPVLTQVITSKDIEKSDATDLRDLLQQMMPGVEFSYAMNQQVHMNFSGFGGQSMLVLVDGERLAGETMDDVDFSRLNMQNVDHIEIVKSAASALYGSNAAGGVINIITKDAMKKFGLNVNGRIGRHSNQRYGLSLFNGGSKWGNTLMVNRTSMDNYNVTSGPNPVSRVISTIYGDETWNFCDQFIFKPSTKWKITGRAGYFFRQMKRSPDTPERYRDFLGMLKAEWNISEKDNLLLSYNFDQYDKSTFQRLTDLDVRTYSNVQNSFRMLYTHTFNASNVLTAGADYMHDYLYNTRLTGSDRHQDSFDAFAQYDWTINSKLEAVGAVRYDYFSDESMNRVTPKLSLRYRPVTGLNIRLGYGMGFRAPTLKEKYYDFDMAGIWLVEGNPDLKAETSHNFNLSAEYSHSHYNFTVSGYYNDVHNKIGTGAPYYASASDIMPRLPYINLANYKVTGVDATAQARWLCGITARISYAYVHEQLPKNKDGQKLNNQYLPARKNSVTAHVDWDHDFTSFYSMNIGLDGRYLSSVNNQEFVDYYDVSKGVNNIHYPGYSLWKLQMVNRFGKKQAVKLTLTVDNLFNYKPDYYYLNCPLTDGASFMAGLSVDIDKLF